MSAQGQITLTSENDFYAPNNKDRNFSNGAQVTYSTPEYDYRFIHNLYTPQDITNPNLIENDRPYAGFVAVSKDRVWNDGFNRKVFGATVGLIGPAALGEDVQSTVHNWSNSRDPKGWDNQLNNEPILNLRYESDRMVGSDNFQIGRGFRIDAGNFLTGISFRAPIKAGYNVSSYRDQRVIIEGLEKKSEWSFGLELDLAIKFVAYDVTLDGNLFSDSHSVEKEWFYTEIGYGGFVQKGDVSVGVKQVRRGEQFKGQDGGQYFGVIRLSF